MIEFVADLLVHGFIERICVGSSDSSAYQDAADAVIQLLTPQQKQDEFITMF